MIHQIRIDNFKSLVDFEIRLASFTCLVGLNGAGKSTVLQALDFISQQMRGDIDGWLEQRQWVPGDLDSKLTAKKNVTLYVQVDDIQWEGRFNRQLLRCTYEEVFQNGTRLMKVEDGEVFINRSTEPTGPHLVKNDIMFEYQGSILSQLKESQISKPLQSLKDALINIRSLDLLSPEYLRQRTRDSAGHLGLGGQKLSAYLHEQGGGPSSAVVAKAATCIPSVGQY